MLAELQEAGQQSLEDGPPGPVGAGSPPRASRKPGIPSPCGDRPPTSRQAAAPAAGMDGCTVVHVVSCEEEFQQQKLDLLWWKLDDQAPLRQVSGAGAPLPASGPENLCRACWRPGPSDPDLWGEVGLGEWVRAVRGVLGEGEAWRWEALVEAGDRVPSSLGTSSGFLGGPAG